MDETGMSTVPSSRKRMRDDLFDEAPPETLKLVSDSGYINSALFMDWIAHFKKYAQPTAENPILLIYDNHISHRSLQVINFCRENWIHILSLPPHASHKLQPLDKAFLGLSNLRTV